MRIIFDIGRKSHVMSGGSLHAKHVDLERPDSFEATVNFFPHNQLTGEPEQPFELHGSAVHVLNLLREAVRQLEGSGQIFVERGELEADWHDTAAPEKRWRAIIKKRRAAAAPKAKQ